jgi:predicted anti-sigma-YlaC factor YlaD
MHVYYAIMNGRNEKTYVRRARLSTKAIAAALTLTVAAGAAVVWSDRSGPSQVAETGAMGADKILTSGSAADAQSDQGLIRQ